MQVAPELPYGGRDILELAVAVDCSPSVVRDVLRGGRVHTRTRQRLWRHLDATKRLHWIADPKQVAT
jgi:hypothetical protein